MKTTVLICLLALTGGTASAQIDAIPSEPTESRWLLGLSLGVVAWPSLGDIESTSGDTFNRAGMDISLSAHRNSFRWRSTDVYLGAEVGFFGYESSIPARDETVSQSGFYLTPSAKFHFNPGTDLNTYLELGVGWYGSDMIEFDCEHSGYACAVLDTYHETDAFGGFVGGRIGRNLFANFRVHFVDFGEVSGPNGLSGDLGGPFYVLSGGFSF